jgi:hypothetical protein
MSATNDPKNEVDQNDPSVLPSFCRPQREVRK